jgi:hypothetical protein
MRKLSRLEASKEARRVLNKCGVDLTQCQYSVAGMDVRLTGSLKKYDSSEFSIHQVESLILEFQRLLPGFSVSGELDNWNFSTNHITRLSEKAEMVNQESEGFVYEVDYDSEVS